MSIRICRRSCMYIWNRYSFYQIQFQKLWSYFRNSRHSNKEILHYLIEMYTVKSFPLRASNMLILEFCCWPWYCSVKRVFHWLSEHLFIVTVTPSYRMASPQRLYISCWGFLIVRAWILIKNKKQSFKYFKEAGWSTNYESDLNIIYKAIKYHLVK